MLAEAARETDPAARRGGEARGRARCAAWRCPRDRHEPNVEKLGPAERETIERVQRLTGYRATTCPCEALYRPEVARACRAKRAGWVATIEPDPPFALVEAVAAVERGEGEYLEYLRTSPRQQSPAATVQAMPGPITSASQLPRRKSL